MNSFFSRAVSRRSRLQSSAASCHFNLPEPLEARIAPAAVAWINGAGGDWKDGVNWSGGVVPTDQDDVSILDFPGTITITITTGAQHAKTLTAAENLTLTGGSLELGGASSISGALSLLNTTLMVDGALNVTGDIAWNGGVTLIGAGSLTSHGTVTYASNDTVQANFNNAGIFNVTMTAGSFSVAAGVTFTNQVGGVFNVTGGHTFANSGTLANAGTFNVVSGYSLLFGSINNTGTLHVLGGEFDLRSDSTSSGVYDVDAGGALGFIAGTGTGVNHITAGGQLNGAGRYLVSAFGNLAIDAGSVTIRNLQIDPFCLVGGSGDVVIPNGGVVTWEGGSFYGTGKTIVQAGAVLNARDVSFGESLEDHEMDLSGTLNLNATGFNLHEQSTLNVLAGGVVNLLGRAQLTGSGASLLTVLSGGTINSNAPGSYTVVSATSAGISGAVHSIAGALVITSALTTTGTYTTDVGATTVFSGGFSDQVMQPGTQWLGDGLFAIDGHVTVQSGVTLTVKNAQIQGTLGGTGTFNISAGGALSFPSVNGGSMADAGITNIGVGATVTGIALSLRDSRVLNNDGTITVNGIASGATSTATAPIINNHAGATISLVPAVGQTFVNAGFRFVLNNAGTFIADTSAVNGVGFDGLLNNSGLVEATGNHTLTLGQGNVSGTGVNTGEFRADAGATINFFYSAVLSAGTQFTGDGTFSVVGANLTLADAGLDLHPHHLFSQSGGFTGPGTITLKSGDTWNLNFTTLTDMGDFRVQSGATLDVDTGLSLTRSSLQNFGEIDVTGTNGFFVQVVAATFTNEASGVVHLDAGGTSGTFGSSTGALVNHGFISRGGTGTGASYVFFNTIDNDGTFEAAAGSVQFIKNPVQISGDGTTLTGGTWRAVNGASLYFFGIATQDDFGHLLSTVVSNAADVTLSGVGASFNAVDNIATNTGALRVLGGATYTSRSGDLHPAVDPQGFGPGPLTNTGTLEIGAGSTVNVGADFTQTALGTLLLHVAGTPVSGAFGKIAAVGNAAFGGTLDVRVDANFIPVIGDSYAIATYASTSGAFANVTGVQPLFAPLKTTTQFTITGQSAPSDLMPLTLAPPANGVAGQPITIPFSVKNLADVATAANAWTDSIYISASATFDATATLLGRVPHNGALAGGDTYNSQFTGNLPPLLAGSYHVFILTDSRAQVAESDDANNLFSPAGTLAVGVPTLTPGTTFIGTIAAGQDLIFRVDLPNSATQIHLTGAVAGEAELFLSHLATPTPSASDAFAFDPASVSQSLTVADPITGSYYILLHGREAAGTGAAFALSADALAFSVLDAGPFAGTNNGDITLTIHGAQFSDATAFTLMPHSGSGATLSSIRVQVRDGTTVFATFNLRGASIGDYDLHAQNGAAGTTLSDAFNVFQAPAIDPDLQINVSLVAPVGIRVGRTATVLVSYNNPTGHDLPAPLLILSSDNGTFTDTDEHYTRFVEFFAVNPNGPADVLPAGFQGSRFFHFEPDVAQAGVRSILTLDTVDRTAPLDLDKLEIETRFPGIFTDAEWNAVRSQLVQQLGPTYGDYERVLRHDIALLPEEFGDRVTPISLLQIELLEARAAINTSIRGVATASDPALDLSGRLVQARNVDTGARFSAFSLEDGSFIFPKVTPGHYTFRFDGAINATTAAFEVAAGQHAIGASIALVPGASLSGSLLTAGAGLPISSGLVTATAADGTQYIQVSHEDGSYELAGLPNGTYRIVAEADGRARSIAANVVIGAAGAALDFSLAPESVIVAHTTLGAGGPAAGLTTIVATLEGSTDDSGRFVAAADATGAFQLHGLPAGQYDLSIFHGGYLSSDVVDLVLAAGVTLDAGNITLLAGATIAGTVTATDPALLGRIAVGAFVGDHLLGVALSDVNGAFTIADLPAGSYTIAPVDFFTFANSANATVAAGDHLGGIALEIHPGGKITGTVLDSASSQPLAHVAVFARAPDGTLLSEQTDDMGHYVFDHVGIGTHNVYLGLDGPLAKQSVIIANLDGATATADLQAAIAAKITGTLRLPDGTVVKNGTVILRQGGHDMATALSDANGVFTFILKQGGTFDLVADSLSGSFAPATNVTVSTGTVTRDFTAGTSSLQLNVSDSAGSVATAIVSVVHIATGLEVADETVGTDGIVSLANLVPGDYRVLITGSNNRGAFQTVTVTGASTQVSIAEGLQASLTGHVTAGAAPASGGFVTLYSTTAADLTFSAVIAADGSYTIPNVPAGTYDIATVRAGSNVLLQTGFTVSGATTMDGTLTSSGDRHVIGQVVDTEGNNFADVTVSLRTTDGRILGETTTDVQGNFEISSAFGSNLQLVISTPGSPDFIARSGVNIPQTSGPSPLLKPAALPQPMAVGSTIDLGQIVSNSVAQGLNAIIDFLGGLSPFKVAAQAKLFQVLYDRAVMFDYDPDHVFDDFSANAMCQKCDTERNMAMEAKIIQDREYRQADLAREQLKLQIDILGAKITLETLENARTVLGIFQVGAAFKALKLAQAGFQTPKLLQIAQGLTDTAQSANDVGTISQEYLDPSSAPKTTVGKIGMATQDLAKTTGYTTNVVGYIQSLSGASTIGLTKVGIIASLVDKVVGFQTSIDALNYQDSLKYAGQIVKTEAKFDQEVEEYYKVVPDAAMKAQKYYDCLAKNSADPNCKPIPKPDDPNKPNKPIAGVRPRIDPIHPITQGNAFDPNDIIGPAGAGSQHFVGVGQTLPYTIDFENIAAATAAAAEVKVTSQLDSDLDFNSFRLTSFGFGGHTYEIPSGRSSFSERLDLRSELGVFVDFEAGVDLTTGAVHWSLSAIDPLTGDVTGDLTHGVLPPNVDGVQGAGFVSYTVQAKTNAHTGDRIDAQASIVFDANDAILTAAIFNTIDAVAPVAHVDPISVNGMSGPDFTVRWSGSDDVGGSGLATFDVYVSDNGGQFAPLVLGTTHHAAIFSGVVGHTYDFVVSAVDGAGNHETLPLVADASVTVVAGTTFTLDARHPVQVHDSLGKLVTIKLSGHGSGIVSLVNGVLDTADLRAIVLSGTDATTALKITTTKGGSVNVGRITSAGSLGSISLSSSAVLGNGYDDGADDLVIGGSLKSLALGDVAAFTQLKIGGSLTDADAAKATLNLNFRDALGVGITTDFATKVGVVNVHSWAFDGLLNARQSVKGLSVTTGDFRPEIDLDSASQFAGVATLGAVNIKAGGLFGSSFLVEGSLGDVKVKGAIGTLLNAASIGAIGAGSIGASTIVALAGNIGNVMLTGGSLASSTLRALDGGIGNITAKLTNQSATISAIDSDTIEAQRIGNITASVLSSATYARAIFASYIHATTGSIGNVSASVAGSALADAIAIDATAIASDGGAVGKITAKATSAAADLRIAAIRESGFFAGTNLGNVAAVALATSKNPATGRAAAIQGEYFDVNFYAGASIGKIIATASGAADANVAIDIAPSHGAFFNAGTDIGAIALKVENGRATAASNQSASGANFHAGRNIGALTASGDATAAQIDYISLVAGGRIGGLNISAKNKDAGTIIGSFLFAGQGHVIDTAADLKAASLGFIKVSGSMLNSQIIASGNVGAIGIGKNADGNWFVAGVDTGIDGGFLTGDDSYNAHASIASVSVGGRLAYSTVAAGIDPGADFQFGTDDDFAGATGALATRSKIGSIKLGAASGASTPLIAIDFNHSEAIESLVLTSLKIGTGAVVKNFTAAGVVIDLDSNGVGDPGEVVVRTV